MARPVKQGIDYFAFDVNFFSDKKIKILKSRYGADGVILYIYLLCEIYKNGYYIILDDDWEFLISDDLCMSSEKVKQVLNFLLERSLFDDKLFQSDKVLTSTRIQKHYQEAVKSRAKKTNIVIDDYWILTSKETASYIKVTQNAGFSEKNKSFSKKNEDNSENNDIKKSKVNKSKVNNNVQNNFAQPTKQQVDVFFEEIWMAYPKKRGKGQISDATKRRLFDIGIEHLKRAISRYTSECDDVKFLKNGSTFFNAGYVDYLDENYSELPKKNSTFSNREYDYDDLESKLINARRRKR